MALVVDYYFAPPSPWSYLGHERFAAIAKSAGATINVLPVDLGVSSRFRVGCLWPSGRRSARPIG